MDLFGSAGGGFKVIESWSMVGRSGARKGRFENIETRKLRLA